MEAIQISAAVLEFEVFVQVFFRRHCVVAQFLKEFTEFDYVLFIDSDIGVVNPKRRIEEFIDPKMEIIFYDRFFNWEVMAGSYLVRDSKWSQTFLKGKFFMHRAYLAELIMPANNVELPVCLSIYNNSKGFPDLFLYEACIRNALGSNTTFGKIKILPKGTGWARDNWMTNSKWNKDRDFMIHNWKNEQLRAYSKIPLPLSSESGSKWYNPTVGPVELSLCTPG
ncbi:unnamed protein product [Angiostrongylus costaricensis]|uniref:Nucleotide-diphospho-sugar transferase domain-containing protein n=1 Tax=Angiostrongylus costaricensis TaxID=334426 RepID=A0A3P7HHP0_ANGCS|nr:unnamed protein product [Angiostrongylus costaricensis]